ncbi:related to cytochrome P450 7A1 [Cephalotrichum gorgonifer]|uniref:Related to cytochrome P450 7A1 n=1 Tax=Cephalotrichum gorgonifer TaxID=2041049 RepID=A0AAE8MWD3_9PEZI|nr:related to cytochrome P450 7A1 [Cephalotrichum gorgonifer]
MPLNTIPPGVITLVLGFLLVVVIARALKKRPDPREPPLKHPLANNVTSAQQPHPIFTVELPGQKNYIVTSPELVQAVHRNAAALSFSPAMVPAFRKLMGFDEEGIELIFRDAHTESGFYGEIHRVQKASLLPGTESLEQLCTLVRGKLMRDVNEFPPVQDVHLFAWVQDMFMRSNNSACFGEKDPFTLDPSLSSTFWKWEAHMKILLLGIPWIFNPKGVTTARETRKTLVTAFLNYLNDDGLDSACSFIKDLSGLGIRRGLSNENNARALLGSVLAIVGNTVPTTFWLLLNIYSRPSLLDEIRNELQATLPDTGTEAKTSLEVARIRERCPVLIAAYDETLRLTSGIAAVRYTNEDTVVAGSDGRSWLLQRGAQIQMPTAFIHADPATWGPNAASLFDHTRFLRPSVAGDGNVATSAPPLSREQRTRRTAAFRPFGGGGALCPGRHFATHEILSFVGSLLLGFDMEPVEGKEFRLPEMDRSKLPLTSMKPVGDISVRFVRRDGCGKFS